MKLWTSLVQMTKGLTNLSTLFQSRSLGRSVCWLLVYDTLLNVLAAPI